MQYRKQIEKIRVKLINGVITYKQAKTLAMPIIAEINKTAIEIAKKHNKKPTLFTFSSLMR